jgi:hypothetical protein
MQRNHATMNPHVSIIGLPAPRRRGAAWRRQKMLRKMALEVRRKLAKHARWGNESKEITRPRRCAHHRVFRLNLFLRRSSLPSFWWRSTAVVYGSQIRSAPMSCWELRCEHVVRRRTVCQLDGPHLRSDFGAHPAMGLHLSSSPRPSEAFAPGGGVARGSSIDAER